MVRELVALALLQTGRRSLVAYKAMMEDQPALFRGHAERTIEGYASNAHDPKGTGSMASKGAIAEASPLHQMHLRSHDRIG